MTTPGAAPAGRTPQGPAGHTPGAAPERDVDLNLGGKPSGLRNPSRAIRGLGAGVLVLEALVLLMAIQPIRILNDGSIGPAPLTVLLGGAVAAVLITGLLRHKWGWWLGSILQLVLLASTFLDWAIGAVGVIFGLVWVYVLHVRRSVLG